MTQSASGTSSNTRLVSEPLYQGWSAISRHAVVGGFDVVLLRENSGREAFWWVNSTTGAHEASHVMALQPEAQNRFLTALDPILWPVAEGVLKGTVRSSEGFFPQDLPPGAILEATATWLNRHAPHMILIRTGHADNGEQLVCPNGRVVREGRMRTLLSSKRGGASLVVASPFSDMPVKAQLTMHQGPLTAYRFQDPTDDTVFYILWNEQNPEARPSFYYPDAPLVISDDPQAPFIPARILAWYACNKDHAAELDAARPFLPEDFGVGRASALRRTHVTKSEDSAKVTSDQAPQQASAGASFLPDIPFTATEQKKKSGLMSHIKRLFDRKTHKG